MIARDLMPRALNAATSLGGALIVVVLVALGLRDPVGGDGSPAAKPGPIAMDDLKPCVLDRSGYLHGKTYGAISVRVDWTGEDIECGGMTRPDERGVRLVFAQRPDAQSNRLMFVLGINRGLQELLTGESSVNVTIIDERAGRFFGTRGMDRCWTQVRAVRQLPSQPQEYRVDGDFYCAGSIPSLSDNSSVTLGDFHYSGRLTLEES